MHKSVGYFSHCDVGPLNGYAIPGQSLPQLLCCRDSIRTEFTVDVLRFHPVIARPEHMQSIAPNRFRRNSISVTIMYVCTEWTTTQQFFGEHV